jgi:hypothetical protein
MGTRGARIVLGAPELTTREEKTVAELGPLYLAHTAMRDAATTHCNRESRWRRNFVPALSTRTPRTIERKDVVALHR